MLVVINALRRNGVMRLETRESVGLAFVDVDANRSLEPIDVLQIINELDRSPARGEGTVSTVAMNGPGVLAATVNPSAVDFTNSLDSWLPSHRKRAVAF